MTGTAKTFTRRLLRWYDGARRDLPWRADATTGRVPSPYHVLVSEAMLQQTQVATVIPYFHRFIARFPTLADLAAADEQEVLRLWQGLGYYSRARNLLAAARTVVGECGGQLPDTVEGLLALPGVGRYTAGAVASIAFGRRAPILDGNVTRVLCRLDRIESDPREPSTQALLWQRAEEVIPAKRAGDFNSAMMELGATVCTPRAPRCLTCPVRVHCEAAAAGVQDRIPTPRKAKATPLFHRHVYCVRRDDRWLIEQRPAKGRWAGMWQFVTAEATDGLARQIGRKSLVRIGDVSHALTHRRYHFAVFTCDAHTEFASDHSRPRKWVTLDELSNYPLPRPHIKIAGMLASLPKD